MLYQTKNIGEILNIGNLASIKVLKINPPDTISIQVNTKTNTVIQIMPDVYLHLMKSTSQHQARFGIDAPKEIRIS